MDDRNGSDLDGVHFWFVLVFGLVHAFVGARAGGVRTARTGSTAFAWENSLWNFGSAGAHGSLAISRRGGVLVRKYFREGLGRLHPRTAYLRVVGYGRYLDFTLVDSQ